jgi:hypothetical protein
MDALGQGGSRFQEARQRHQQEDYRGMARQALDPPRHGGGGDQQGTMPTGQDGCQVINPNKPLELRERLNLAKEKKVVGQKRDEDP